MYEDSFILQSSGFSGDNIYENVLYIGKDNSSINKLKEIFASKKVRLWHADNQSKVQKTIHDIQPDVLIIDHKY